MEQKALVLYFSGTGGTQRVAATFADQLRTRGIQAELAALDASKSNRTEIFRQDMLERADWVFILFAVHAFDAPDPVYRWLEGQNGGGRRTAVISVSGGGEAWPNLGCRYPLCHALEAKGFRVVYEKMMVMPCNWVFHYDDHLSMQLMEAVPGKVEKILDSLLAGNVRRTRFRMSAMQQWVSRQEKADGGRFGKSIAVTEHCTGCGWCADHCPVNNIAMKEKRPVYDDQCILCFRCLYGCPKKALHMDNFMVLKAGFGLADLEKRMKGVALKPVEVCARGLKNKGVRQYLTDQDGY